MLEAADTMTGAAVAADLLVNIADEPDLNLLGRKLRSTPVKVHVDAVLVLGGRVDEIVGEAKQAGKFVSGLRIEIGVTARIDRPMPDPNVGQPHRVISPNGNITVGHVIVDAGIPAQGEHQSPKAVNELVISSKREKGTEQPDSVPVSSPANEAVSPPKIPIRPTEARPPSTGVAKT